VAIDFFTLVNPKRAFAFQVSHDVGAQFVSAACEEQIRLR